MKKNIKLKSVKDQTIVITGASSGIGLATAKMAFKKGANLVLAARNEEALAEIVQTLDADERRVVYVPADVSKKEDVQRIVEIAIDRFKGFDTWINNAGVSVVGRLEEVSESDHRRLFETNFWGLVYGSLAAVMHLRHKGGALINLGSEVSDIAFPLQGMYSASKHAVKGFTEALRVEMMDEDLPISITLIKPAAIGTPFFDHAKNYMDHDTQAPPPVYKAEEVACAILYAASHPMRDIYIGSASRMFSALRAFMPHMADWMGKKMMYAQLSKKPNPGRHDNLYEAESSGKIRGCNVGRPRFSLYTRAQIHPKLTMLAALAAIGLAAAAYHKLSRR